MAELLSRHCPYCGESIELLVDTSLLAQAYIEDCHVCCQPMTVTVSMDANDMPEVQLSREDDA
ncbi:MAG: CPXCG motif-containing cysteine-rich protein [Xanthomonadales bacterium]|nr:CPXCG motif-containing cysteine-rich protein [Xanthomonadales bacterium]